MCGCADVRTRQASLTPKTAVEFDGFDKLPANYTTIVAIVQ